MTGEAQRQTVQDSERYFGTAPSAGATLTCQDVVARTHALRSANELSELKTAEVHVTSTSSASAAVAVVPNRHTTLPFALRHTGAAWLITTPLTNPAPDARYARALSTALTRLRQHIDAEQSRLAGADSPTLQGPATTIADRVAEGQRRTELSAAAIALKGNYSTASGQVRTATQEAAGAVPEVVRTIGGGLSSELRVIGERYEKLFRESISGSTQAFESERAEVKAIEQNLPRRLTDLRKFGYRIGF